MLSIMSALLFPMPGMFSPINLLGGGGQPEQQGPQKKSDPLGMLYFLCSVHSRCITVFTRTGFGIEGLGIPAVCSLVLLLICLPGDPGMIFWLGAWFVAVIVQRIITFRMIRKGAVIHSRFAGHSLLLKIPFLRKEKYIMAIEAILCLFLGVLVMAISQFMGAFLALGFVSIMVQMAIDDSLRQRRIQQMQDARLEAQWYRDGMN